MLTIRQRIADLLSHEDLSLADLAARMGMPIKEVLPHLNHVQRSVRPPRRFLVQPAECESCGFIFKDRRKLNPPGRCPKCKSNRILEPRYRIR